MKSYRLTIISIPYCISSFVSPPTSPVENYCSAGPRLEDLYDEINQLELDAPRGSSNDVTPAALREEEEAAHIFENYSFDHTYSPDLPITSYRQQIVDTVESNSVTVIQGWSNRLSVNFTQF